jgi:4'-phosphopantetheinyl transferase
MRTPFHRLWLDGPVTGFVRIVGIMTAPAIDEVDVWIVELDIPAGAELDAAALSKQEAERYAGLEHDARALAVTARAVLRRVLGKRLGMAPEDVRIVEGDDAKPTLAGGDLEFNVTHSDRLALIAVARVPVGVDIERVEKIASDEFDDLIAFVLTPRELDELVHLPERDRLAAYYRVWTRKEAFVKATGEGIAGRPLPEVVVEVGTPGLVEVVGVAEEELSRWTVLDVDVPAGYAASLVVRHREPRLRTRRWRRR